MFPWSNAADNMNKDKSNSVPENIPNTAPHRLYCFAFNTTTIYYMLARKKLLRDLVTQNTSAIKYILTAVKPACRTNVYCVTTRMRIGRAINKFHMRQQGSYGPRSMLQRTHITGHWRRKNCHAKENTRNDTPFHWNINHQHFYCRGSTNKRVLRWFERTIRCTW